MANDTTLKATTRTDMGKGAARKLRAAGRVPAILYGPGTEPRQLSVDTREMERLFSRISVENTLLELQVDEDRPVRVLVREVQSHAYRPEILHVDFYAVRKGEMITLEVPVQLVGNPAGVVEGGILNHSLTSLEIRCVPANIPEAIEVDVAELQVGDSIRVGDITLPEGVETLVDPEQSVCSVVAPTTEALEPTPEQGEGPGGEVQPELVEPRGGEES